MDVADLIPKILELGVSGLFFVMWFYERKDRLAALVALADIRPRMKTVEDLFGRVLNVVEANTKAMNSLSCQAPQLASVIQSLTKEEHS